MRPEILQHEIQYKAVKSSGSGGQHVNKTSSKVMLFFDLQKSEAFSEEEKDRLLKKLASKLTQQGVLILSEQESRSQFRNKALVTARLKEMIEEALILPIKRKATQPSKSAKLKRAKDKHYNSLKKSWRKKPSHDE